MPSGQPGGTLELGEIKGFLMKKVFVFLLCLLAIFAMVSCNQEPEQEGGGDTTPAAPEDENGGTLTVRAAEGADFPQADRFQFLIDQPLETDDEIEFLMKCSEVFTSIIPRSGNSESGYAKFGTFDIEDLSVDADGWYKVETDVTEDTELFGITLYLPEGEDQDETLFVSIKNLKINGKIVDFSEYDPENCLATLMTPDALVAVITE